MKKLTAEKFRSRLDLENVTLLGEYKNNRTAIAAHCKPCNNTWMALPKNLMNGCGCPKCRSLNKIIKDRGGWLEVDVSTKTLPEAVMKIDRIDYAYLKMIGVKRMYASLAKKSKYPYANTLFSGKICSVHRLLVDSKGKSIDHINRDGLDNRMSNLRVCKACENAINKGVYKNNTSGAQGVSFNKTNKKWVSYITVNKKRDHLGSFSERKLAVNARELAEKEKGVFIWK